MKFFINNLRACSWEKRKYFYVTAEDADGALGKAFSKLKHTEFHIEEAQDPPARIYKSTWTDKQDTPGIYLLLPGSNSVWCGFKSQKEAETCRQVLPGWKLLIRK